MNILYIGDIMGRPGIDVVAQILPDLRKEKLIDLVIAQGENVTEGKGMSVQDLTELQGYGVDFFTGGNWSLFRDEILKGDYPVTRPANYPDGTPGVGSACVETATGSVLVVSLLGKIVGKDAEKPVKNPLQTIDDILEENPDVSATIVNFHGDYSSEKRVIGYYLDGRVTAVLGDHWHVPTADAMVLPGGTAHMTDVGMCGSLHSSLGVKTEIIVDRWLHGKINKNQLETTGPFQFNAALITEQHGKATAIEHIQKIIP